MFQQTLITSVNYSDGWRRYAGFEPEFDEDLVGWHCQVSTDDRDNFKLWVKECCPSAEVTWRFNGGIPYFAVHIKNEQEFTLFLLKWNSK